MSGGDELRSALIAAQRDRQTGRLYAYCKGNERGVRVRPAEADFDAGRMIRFRFAGLHGRPALAEIAGQVVDRVMFMPSASIDTESDDQLPDMSAILTLLGGALSAPAHAAATAVTVTDSASSPPQNAVRSGDDTAALLEEACSVLTEIYGKDAQQVIARIAKDGSPAADPQLFLRRCRREITDALVGPAAQQLYGPLLAKLPPADSD